MAKYNVQPGQSLYDVAVLCFGTVQALLPIISLNPGIDINTKLLGNETLNIPDSYTGTPETRRVLTYLTNRPNKPATQPRYAGRVTEDGQQRITDDNQDRIV